MTTGCDKSTRRVKFRFRRRANHRYDLWHPVPREGALAIVTERWDGMRWTRRHRARKRIAGRDQLRERSLGRADERRRSVRQNRVDLTPQWSASSLWKASRPDRARMSQLSAGDGGEKSPILRGEREISRQTIAQGMSDVLRCPVCSCAAFCTISHTRPRVQRASGIPCSLIREGRRHANLGRLPPREYGRISGGWTSQAVALIPEIPGSELRLAPEWR